MEGERLPLRALHCHRRRKKSGSTTNDMDDVHKRRRCGARCNHEKAVELARDRDSCRHHNHHHHHRRRRRRKMMDDKEERRRMLVLLYVKSSVTAAFGRHGMPPPVCNPDGRLTLKLVCESHLRWGTFVPN